jgi:hypothetical protein
MVDVTSLPTLQAANCTTFTRPPFGSESLTFPGIYAFHALNSSKHPLFIYADSSTKSGTREICYAEAYAAIQRSHGIVSRYHSSLVGDVTQASTVGILANLGMQDLGSNVSKPLTDFTRYYHLHHLYSWYHACRTHALSHFSSKLRCWCRAFDSIY